LSESIFYNGQDITLDIIIKTEHIVTLISEREGIGFDDAYRHFADTATYAALMNPSTLVWAESAEFICDEYQREQRGLM
jgi:hypothetical protein